MSSPALQGLLTREASVWHRSLTQPGCGPEGAASLPRDRGASGQMSLGFWGISLLYGWVWMWWLLGQAPLYTPLRRGPALTRAGDRPCRPAHLPKSIFPNNHPCRTQGPLVAYIYGSSPTAFTAPDVLMMQTAASWRGGDMGVHTAHHQHPAACRRRFPAPGAQRVISLTDQTDLPGRHGALRLAALLRSAGERHCLTGGTGRSFLGSGGCRTSTVANDAVLSA